MPYREQNSNKGTFGKVLNVAGSQNYIGAAYLSSLSALKIGAGYVTLASCDEVIQSVSQMLPEAVFLSREDALKSVNNYTVLLIGCGLGKSDKTKEDFVKFIEQSCNLPTVIDADGLNILAEVTDLKLPSNTIITPHPAEAARLLGMKLENVLSNIESLAKELSEKYNCVIVLKTHRTVICDRDKIYTNEHGNSALAKAGSGDVLAGIIAGLLAQKMTVFEAAKLGVYLHSVAGEFASKDLTEYSVLPSDIIKYLPQAIKTTFN